MYHSLGKFCLNLTNYKIFVPTIPILCMLCKLVSIQVSLGMEKGLGCICVTHIHLHTRITKRRTERSLPWAALVPNYVRFSFACSTLRSWDKFERQITVLWITPCRMRMNLVPVFFFVIWVIEHAVVDFLLSFCLLLFWSTCSAQPWTAVCGAPPRLRPLVLVSGGLCSSAHPIRRWARLLLCLLHQRDGTVGGTGVLAGGGGK